MSLKKDFLSFQGQTNTAPHFLEVSRAEGVFIYDSKNKAYIDMIGGVAVNNIGHNHPKVIKAIKKQLDSHMHVMVYGEFIQSAQINFAKRLTQMLPEQLNCVYPVNSGTEANEAALKLVKRVSGRTELVSFRGSYHGSTHGSMSVSDNESKKEAFRPLLPDVRFLEFNRIEDLEKITSKTAGVIIETVQGDAGVRIPSQEFMTALRKKCDQTGTLLIFDEIQCGIGRTGKMFAFEHFGIVPDILTLGKALGGGMPIGALVASSEHLKAFTLDPMLGHITTFGGHPVVCAAANACLEVMKSEIDLSEVERLGALMEEALAPIPKIIEIRRIGLMFALDMSSPEAVIAVVQNCMEEGLITFWFLSHPNSFRLSPPLTISEKELVKAIEILKKAIQKSSGIK